MKDEFPGFFSNPSDIAKLWDDCLFVLDANVLLHLYRYSDSTRDDLLNVFDSFSDRLWVPHQVADEYLQNRLTVIWDQASHYEEALSKAKALKSSLDHKNQHPFVSPELLAEFGAVFQKLSGELSAAKQSNENRINDDEIKSRLETLLKGRVGDKYSTDRLEQIIVDGKLRYESKIPPGFADQKKASDSARLSDRCRPYGDYIVWLQLIEKAKADQKSIVFVTGDHKEDWWLKFKGRTLGPHPQLVDEFITETGCSFHMYLPESFMDYASKHLNQDASQTTLKELREVREEEAEVQAPPATITRVSRSWASDHVWPSERIDHFRSSFGMGHVSPQAEAGKDLDSDYVSLVTQRAIAESTLDTLRAQLSRFRRQQLSLTDDLELQRRTTPHHSEMTERILQRLHEVTANSAMIESEMELQLQKLRSLDHLIHRPQGRDPSSDV